MVKCPLKSPNGVKCNRHLHQCLRDWSHVGRKWLPKPRPHYVNEAWYWKPPETVLAGPQWQQKIRAEVRHLSYERKYAAEDKNPARYRAASESYALVAGLVVRLPKKGSVGTPRFAGSPRVIGQRGLEGFQ